MVAKRKRGRPKKAKATIRPRTLQVRVTVAEEKAVDTAAKADGMDRSDWLRAKIFGPKKESPPTGQKPADGDA